MTRWYTNMYITYAQVGKTIAPVEMFGRYNRPAHMSITSASVS